jgi:hypothetical protein
LLVYDAAVISPTRLSAGARLPAGLSLLPPLVERPGRLVLAGYMPDPNGSDPARFGPASGAEGLPVELVRVEFLRLRRGYPGLRLDPADTGLYDVEGRPLGHAIGLRLAGPLGAAFLPRLTAGRP